MSDLMITYAITAGIFAFLTAILFASRGKRYASGYTPAEGHTQAQHE